MLEEVKLVHVIKQEQSCRQIFDPFVATAHTVDFLCVNGRKKSPNTRMIITNYDCVIIFQFIFDIH